MDIGFLKEGKIISRNSKFNIISQDDVVTLKIYNKKNRRMGQTLHHETTRPKGAVATLERQLHHILSSCGYASNLIWNIFDNKQWTSVQISKIVAAVRVEAEYINLQFHGIDPNLIGAHSLLADRAMNLKLMGFSDYTIKNIVRWTYHTWEMYIHSQIAKLHEGIAQRMSTNAPFHNIAFIEPPKA